MMACFSVIWSLSRWMGDGVYGLLCCTFHLGEGFPFGGGMVSRLSHFWLLLCEAPSHGGLVRCWPGMAHTRPLGVRCCVWLPLGTFPLCFFPRCRVCLCVTFAPFVAIRGAWLWPLVECRLRTLQHLGALRFPHLRVGVCWASSAPAFLPLWPTRLDLPVRLLVCSLDVLCLPQRTVWCAWASTAAYPVVGLPVVATAVAECNLAGPARCCPRPFSCRASILFPWHARFPLVPRFASPRFVAWLFALDVSARPHCWLLLCVPTIITFIGSSFASMARPSRWLLTCGSRFGSPWHVEGQKFQYGAWLRAPLPKRSASRPRGRLSVVGIDADAPELVDSTSEGPSIHPDSTRAATPASDHVISVVAAPATRASPAPVAASNAANLHGPSAPSEAADLVHEATGDASLDPDASKTAADRLTPDDAPYDPMVHTETSDMLEEALEISRDCVLLADLTGVIQANGEDLVNEAIPEAADSIIREPCNLLE
ncbi:hypothetical protein V6N13_148626 [Hibiscus sabdariffa]